MAREPDFAELRRKMVAELRGGGVSDRRVLEALSEVPREEFVPPGLRRFAYSDRALAIECGQTISQPLVVATMTEALEPAPDDVLLEVGTGSGYQAAVLARLCRRVVTIERHRELADAAEARLRRLGCGNVRVVTGDGSRGYPPEAPYQGILVAAAAAAVPPALPEQLADGGRLVIPVGEYGGVQDLQVIRREAGRLTTRVLYGVMFVPLVEGPPQSR